MREKCIKKTKKCEKGDKKCKKMRQENTNKKGGDK